MTPLFVDVILPIPPGQYFTYAIPPEQESEVEPGKRVVVQFGKQKIYTAIIARIHHDKPENYSAKEIMAVIDDDPIVNTFQFKLWKWISQYYLCSEGEVMAAALPSAMKLQSETVVGLNPEHTNEETIITPEEELVIETLSGGKTCSVHELTTMLGSRKYVTLIRKMIDNGVLLTREELIKKYKPPVIEMVVLTDKARQDDFMKETLDASERRAPKQFELLMTFMQLLQERDDDEVPKKVLLKRASSSQTILKQLIKKEVFNIVERKEIDILKEHDKHEVSELTEAQKEAYKKIKEGFTADKVVLLHGVTSSGKTEVYSRLISDTISSGKQVLYLLPEIALTTQIIERLRKNFGDSLLVYHSRHNQRERTTVYLKILHDGKNNTLQHPIVVGARSAVFLPFKNLGLVIVDEEHEPSYKQFDPAPRYHARDTAIVLGNIHNAHVLLGSATPSLESYYNAEKERYALVELKGRYGGVASPEMMLIDLADAYKRRMVKSHFSTMLLNEMRTTNERGEQVILFQNRRGFAPILQCGNCGWVPHCINCDVSLTYHKLSNKISCHYCGYSTTPHIHCKACESTNVKMKGLGTERIEENVLSYFPNIKVERLDLDTSSSKSSFQRILTSFESGEVDVMVGTQMITKGLDFSNVGLVGVLNADNLLNFPDFRASERSFHLLAQVAGRAGRRNKRGKVMVQTFHPNHPVLKFLATYDYRGFYNYETRERKLYNYPPFCRLIEFRLRHRNENDVEILSKKYSNLLKTVFGKRVLGPVIPSVSRVRNYYIRTLLMKIEKDLSNKKIKEEIHRVTEDFRKDAKHRQLIIQVDVDPH
jgi:primosomal protein N' (replication factor Y) (superfamily II helicase)